MKMSGLIATCSIVLLCAMTLNSSLEIQSTDKITAAIQEQDSVSQTITNNYNETHNHYESNVDNNKISELEEKIIELEEQNKTQIIIENNKEYNKVVDTRTSSKTPWVGPKTHLCPYSAGWPAICGECGVQGGIHQDIIEWMDENNDCHLTHKECFAKYCVDNNVWPNAHYENKI